MAILVGVVDPSPVYRRGLSQALKEHSLEVREVGETQLMAGAVVDVFVIDATGPGGRELLQDTRARYPDTPIVAIVTPSWSRPPQHVAVLTDGATGAVSADAPPSVIASAARAALTDWAVLVLPGEEIRAFSALFDEMLGEEPAPIEDDEVLLLQRLFQGATRQVLTEEFHFARRTLDRRIEDLYRKLNASDHTNAMLRALFWGYLTDR